jgi:hypothetical protein
VSLTNANRLKALLDDSLRERDVLRAKLATTEHVRDEALRTVEKSVKCIDTLREYIEILKFGNIQMDKKLAATRKHLQQQRDAKAQP